MALRKSTQALNRAPAPSARDGVGGVTVMYEHLTVAGEFALNDVVEMGAIPAGMIPVSVKLITEDIDTNVSPAVALDVGLLTGHYLAALDTAGDARTCGAEFFAASTLGQAGGVAESTVLAGHILGAVDYDRSIGLKVQTAAATLAAGKKIRLAVTMVPTPIGNRVTVSS